MQSSVHVCFGSGADLEVVGINVRFGPEADVS